MEGTNSTRRDLEARIKELEQEFASGMRARGFDPAQAANVPLPPALAKIQAARDELIELLESTDE